MLQVEVDSSSTKRSLRVLPITASSPRDQDRSSYRILAELQTRASESLKGDKTTSRDGVRIRRGVCRNVADDGVSLKTTREMPRSFESKNACRQSLVRYGVADDAASWITIKKSAAIDRVSRLLDSRQAHRQIRKGLFHAITQLR